MPNSSAATATPTATHSPMRSSRQPPRASLGMVGVRRLGRTRRLDLQLDLDRAGLGEGQRQRHQLALDQRRLQPDQHDVIAAGLERGGLARPECARPFGSGRIFMTPPSIVMVWISVLAETGELAETSWSAVLPVLTMVT